jgi:5-methyltetrahydropteroyltriglutamate--homocysteine methyltransferase
MQPIRTTHTGSLPRPDDLLELLASRANGENPRGLAERAERAVREVVREQVEAGLDLVNDGEQEKDGYATYVRERLTGFDGEATYAPRRPELDAHPDFADRMRERLSRGLIRVPACTGDIRLRDPQAVQRDIGVLKDAARAAGVGDDRLFLTAASPGVVAHFFVDQHYGNRDAYLAAIADAMRPEYEAIAAAGITLQVDCPDLAMSRNTRFADLSLDEFRREVARNVEALNHVLTNVPAERSRLHLCWGNYEGPHTLDVGLAQIIDLVLGAKPAGISVEAANPRHGHEWKVFEDVRLPDDRYVIPGVIDSTTNFVEHPELVAQRLTNYARVVGPERVVGGTDCGFGTFAGMGAVVPTITWAKLRALAEGARLASGQAAPA